MPIVLVVDDSKDIQMLLKEYLNGIGYTPVIAENGAVAWELLAKEPEKYDAVLLDIMMPEMDGMEVLARMKEDHRLRLLPVIMQTAKSAQKDILEGIKAGAYYYLTKPFDKDTLLAIVKAAVYDYSLRRTLINDLNDAVYIFEIMTNGRFEFRTLEDANTLAVMLAKACPNPDDVAIGLVELMVNAVEHGNLGLTYEEKSALKDIAEWNAEIERRMALPENAGKKAVLEFEHTNGEFRFLIKDAGSGFDWGSYLEYSPARAFDTHGRGIAISNELSFDRLEYRGKGNEVLATVKQ